MVQLKKPKPRTQPRERGRHIGEKNTEQNSVVLCIGP